MEKQYVGFTLENQTFAVDIKETQEIREMQYITKIPNSPIYVEGVTTIRGNIIPILNLKKRLNMDSNIIKFDSRIIIVNSCNPVGFIVDTASEIISVEDFEVISSPSVIKKEYMKNIIEKNNRLIFELNLDEIISEFLKQRIK